MRQTLAWLSMIGLAIILGIMTGCSGNDSGGQPSVGDNYTLSITPNGVTTKAGNQVPLTAVLTKKDGTVVPDPQVTWTVQGAIGTITRGGIFTATTQVSSDAPKTGKILATMGEISATIDVTVTVNDLAKIEIIPPEGVDLTHLRSGARLTFTAVGEDQYGNRGASRFAVSPTWTVVGPVGQINGQGQFLATTIGSGKVVATIGTLTDEVSVSVTEPGDPNSVILNFPAGVDPNNLTIGDEAKITATVVDAAGNTVPGTPTLELQGNIGTLAANELTAENLGSGKIVATFDSIVSQTAVAVTRAFRGSVVYVQQGLYSNLATLSGQMQSTALTTGRNYFGDPDFSPDGSKLVYVSQGNTLNGICIANANGSNAKSIYAVRGTKPDWSPDGSMIAFVKGMGAGEIDVITPSGTLLAKLPLGLAGEPRDPSWSPDSAKLAFGIYSGVAGIDGLYTMNASSGSKPERIYAGDVRYVAWSPNIKYIAVANEHSIRVVNTTTGSADEIVAVTDGVLVGGLAWAPNGSGIIYSVQRGEDVQLYLKIFSTEQVLKLTNLSGAFALDPTWKP